VATWNRIVRAAVDGEDDAAADDASAARSDPRSGWRLGEPVIMTVNDPLTRLSNGDVGIVAGVRPAVLAFPRPPAPDAGRGTEDAAAGGLLLQPAVGLPEVRSAHAITVHRAQGSEYAEVVVIMPPSDSRLATRELLYTALTRAKRRVLLVASEEALRAAVHRSSSRMGGLERAVAALVGTG
jgi:exodeoxyribonuclease V alpha subunit